MTISKIAVGISLLIGATAAGASWTALDAAQYYSGNTGQPFSDSPPPGDLPDVGDSPNDDDLTGDLETGVLETGGSDDSLGGDSNLNLAGDSNWSGTYTYVPSQTSVPEPGILLLLGIGLAGLGFARRKNRS
jgi:hypothetical protein